MANPIIKVVGPSAVPDWVITIMPTAVTARPAPMRYAGRMRRASSGATWKLTMLADHAGQQRQAGLQRGQAVDQLEVLRDEHHGGAGQHPAGQHAAQRDAERCGW